MSHKPLQRLNKAAHSGFETQMRHHQKSETGVSVAPKMDMCPTKILEKKVFLNDCSVHGMYWIISRNLKIIDLKKSLGRVN